MTEAEWLACEDPNSMLEFLRGNVSERKFRLYACAYARQLWSQLDDMRCKHAVEVAEQFADGVAREEDREKAYRAVDEVVLDAVAKQEFERASVVIYAKRCLEKSKDRIVRLDFHFHPWTAADAVLVKDIVANPFRMEPISPACRRADIIALAQSIYDERRFTDMHILADALEEAGCKDAAILEHCRSDGEHVRGCWVIDWLLGRELTESDDDDAESPASALGITLDGSGRLTLAVVSLPFGLLSAWMLWIVHNFLVGNGWFERIVRVILDEFILAVGLFALTLLAGALFSPTWLSRVLNAVTRKLVWATTAIGVLFGTALLIVLFVIPVLLHFGVLR